ncbi:anaerobic sulfite reductase subunit AsrA [Agrilactobacillus yilanensis]|uniref:Anaerobic sulfite reductase subunit AsrA n=1 Tax=Agrilactobacillus yilanensis TaxID=2485997 RepID=A0ABW4J4C8_9LACO|nr:anaerobic sulfite reductase subunit AsrA [Agrilactobacillus yilanensis]
MTTAKLMANRKAFYQLLARLYEKELSPKFIQQLAHLTYPTAEQNPQMQAGYQQLKAYFAQQPLAEMADDLASDYAKTFLGAGETKGNAAFPYESVYTSDEKLVLQAAWENVTKIYRANGLVMATEMADIKEDHIAMELKFMAHLCDVAEPDLAQQTTFLNEHLLNWTPQFLEDVQTYSRTNFYQGVALLTAGFLAEDAKILATLQRPTATTQSFKLTNAAFDQLLAKWQQRYHVYAPTFTTNRNAKQQPMVRFGAVTQLADIVYDRQSDFSAKEIYYPIMQTLFYFNENNVTESTLDDDKDFLIFMHPCDINALKRTDTIFMHNGAPDSYYQRLREKVKIVMMICTESYENCFCVSMQTNQTDHYNLALEFKTDHVVMAVKDPLFLSDFKHQPTTDFVPTFITKNKGQAHLPKIQNQAQAQLAGHLDYWQTFNDRCISCGGCNTVCPTCTCFDTTDIIYDETSLDGERRRVWSSCMLDSFTMTAGGNRVRKTPGDNMRFKTMHKVYDYKQRFSTENMCVGCGRCTQQCPKDISFLDTINGFHDAFNQAKNETVVK